MDGVLNHVYAFFYEWLYGTAVTAPLQNYADSICLIMSIIFVCLIVYCCFAFIFGFVKAIMNIFRGR